MARPLPIAVVLFTLTSLQAPGKPPQDVPELQQAFDIFVEAASHTNWPDQLKARQALLVFGPAIVPKLTETAGQHGNARVRQSCYELLSQSFADDERTADTLLQHGLTDQDGGIRYQAAFYLGDYKVQRAEQGLQDALKRATGADEKLLRFTLAKSLAQLGKADVIRDLIFAVSDDSYMSRYVGNIGLKALSGKSLDDFGGYAYAEGSWVIGGMEFSQPVDMLPMVERKAGRFQAATAYLKWLQAEKPEIYSFVPPRRLPRRTAAP